MRFGAPEEPAGPFGKHAVAATYGARRLLRQGRRNQKKGVKYRALAAAVGAHQDREGGKAVQFAFAYAAKILDFDGLNHVGDSGRVATAWIVRGRIGDGKGRARRPTCGYVGRPRHGDVGHGGPTLRAAAAAGTQSSGTPAVYSCERRFGPAFVTSSEQPAAKSLKFSTKRAARASYFFQ